MTTARELFTNARTTQLGDPDGVTWPNAALIVAYNQAMRLLILKRPDASAKIQTLTLKKGSRQFIPDDGVCLLRVVRNIKPDDSIGDAIRPVSMAALDSMYPGWHNAKAAVVEEFCSDPRSPKHFYVYPAPATDDVVRIDVEYAAMPPDLTSATLDDELPFDSVYDQPLIEFMLYKLLSGDNAQGQSSGVHLKTALDLIDVKSIGDVASSQVKG